jgi:hypothetical protein
MTWKRIKEFATRLGVISGIVVTLSGGSLYVGAKKFVSAIGETFRLKEVMDSVRTEFDIHWKASESLHDDVLMLEEQQKLDFYFDRENSQRHDNKDYYTVFEDGNQVNVDLRDVPEGRDPWAFLMDGTYRKYPARWSEADRKYVILPEDREEYLIYEK